MVDNLYWIWMSLNFGGRYELSECLLKKYGDPKRLYDAASEQPFLPELKGKRVDIELDEAVEIKKYCSANNVGILPLLSEFYPRRLKNIINPPLLLYYRGRLIDFDSRLCIATVGTRSMSDYGRREAYKITYDLAKRGFVIVSGMALGVDGVCHRAALDAGGITAAVLGCGIDRVYPSEHKNPMEEIVQHGIVLTEYKPGTPPTGRNFPVRNRIISGLSNGTFVVEAGAKSGALITARTALFQGRDIFAMPGKIGEMNSVGTNSLIVDGANVVTCAGDIIKVYYTEIPPVPAPRFNRDELDRLAHLKSVAEKTSNAPAHTETEVQPEVKAEKTAKQTAAPQKTPMTAGDDSADVFNGLTEFEQIVYNTLKNGEATSDDIITGGYPASDIMTALTMLEIKGIIEPVPGGRFTLKQ